MLESRGSANNETVFRSHGVQVGRLGIAKTLPPDFSKLIFPDHEISATHFKPFWLEQRRTRLELLQRSYSRKTF